ncbi:serum paraoxonase/arylesterase 2-like [Liolophura sinensis]|uniref:serum paraoxonase/arylesterase 2-like n=1 Tax=Liolophura sinensis TaxID=3198878 RepID=UPI003158E74E
MWGKLVLIVFLAVILQHVVRFLFLINTFQKVFNHAPGPCRKLPSVVNGSEDAYVLSNGLLFISSGFGHSGKILRLDLDADVTDTEEFRIEGDFDPSSLSPHGLSVWQNPKSGEVTLFVVSHARAGERVEVFRHDGTKTSKVLKHLRTITDPDFKTLNDLVATGPDSFYATICYTFGLAVDFLLLYPGGGVLRYDHGKTTVLDTGLVLGNGINISPDKRYLHVAEIARRNIVTYEIQADKTIKRAQVFDTQTGPDNIHVDPDTGDLWIGGHPNSYLASFHLSAPEKNYPAYSQVLRMKVDRGKITSVREVYVNDGSEIMASSIAIPYKKTLFIGSVIEGAVVCELIYPG